MRCPDRYWSEELDIAVTYTQRLDGAQSRAALFSKYQIVRSSLMEEG